MAQPLVTAAGAQESFMCHSRAFVSAMAAFGALALLVACTSGQSQIQTSERLPRPQVVLVDDFAASPEKVQLDAGLSAEIEQAARERHGTSRTEQGTAISRQAPMRSRTIWSPRFGAWAWRPNAAARCRKACRTRS